MYNYNGTPYGKYEPSYVANLEARVKALEAQKHNMVDPKLTEFYNSAEYQAAKKDCFLSFLESMHPQWLASPYGQKFSEWEREQFDKFKQDKNGLSN